MYIPCTSKEDYQKFKTGEGSQKGKWYFQSDGDNFKPRKFCGKGTNTFRYNMMDHLLNL